MTPLAGALRDQLELPRDFKCVARPFGHAEAYVADGAALIGDAVHPMTPAGGQGANASIWDALALADVADAALRAGDVSRARLAPYEDLRRLVVAVLFGIGVFAATAWGWRAGTGVDERSFRRLAALVPVHGVVAFFVAVWMLVAIQIGALFRSSPPDVSAATSLSRRSHRS